MVVICLLQIIKISSIILWNLLLPCQEKGEQSCRFDRLLFNPVSAGCPVNTQGKIENGCHFLWHRSFCQFQASYLTPPIPSFHIKILWYHSHSPFFLNYVIDHPHLLPQNYVISCTNWNANHYLSICDCYQSVAAFNITIDQQSSLTRINTVHTFSLRKNIFTSPSDVTAPRTGHPFSEVGSLWIV